MIVWLEKLWYFATCLLHADSIPCINCQCMSEKCFFTVLFDFSFQLLRADSIPGIICSMSSAHVFFSANYEFWQSGWKVCFVIIQHLFQYSTLSEANFFQKIFLNHFKEKMSEKNIFFLDGLTKWEGGSPPSWPESFLWTLLSSENVSLILETNFTLLWSSWK